MGQFDWAGSRPQVCSSVCAASPQYWRAVEDSKLFPRRWTGEISRHPNRPPMYQWNLWWYCQECHQIMHKESKFLRELKECLVLD